MKVTVIGCWGGFPAKDGATSSYLFEKDGYSLLVDAGSGALSKLQKYTSVAQLDAVILSHYHHDHVADVGVLQYAKIIEHYVKGTDDVLPIYGHTLDEQGFAALTDEFTKGIAYDPEKELEAGPFRISFLKTEHPVPCFGMRITDGNAAVVYTADTSFSERWIPFSRDADLFIADCNYYAGMDGTKSGHMNSEEAATIAEEARVKNVMLSHLPQYGDIHQLVTEAKRIYSGNVFLAQEGLVWNEIL